MRVQQVSLFNEFVQVAYLEDDETYRTTGIQSVRMLDIPHGIIGEALFADLIDSVQQIVDEAHVQMRKPPVVFTIATSEAGDVESD